MRRTCGRVWNGGAERKRSRERERSREGGREVEGEREGRARGEREGGRWSLRWSLGRHADHKILPVVVYRKERQEKVRQEKV